MAKINDYLPKVLQSIVEFQQINSDLDVELNNIDKLIDGINNETIVRTATEYGISKWEKALGIISSDSDSLEVRRFRINNILTSKLPYTLRWLKNKLTQIVGSESGWTLNVNYHNYTITITLSGLDTNLMLEVQKQLRNSIPANMELEIGGPSITSSEIKIGVGLMYATKYLVSSGYEVVPFNYDLSNFYGGSIASDGGLDKSEAGITITSNFIPLSKDMEYEFQNDQNYPIFTLAYYDMYGNLKSRESGLNITEFRTPINCELVRITIMDERGIREDGITNAQLVQK